MLCREARRFESCRPRSHLQDGQRFLAAAICCSSGLLSLIRFVALARPSVQITLKGKKQNVPCRIRTCAPEGNSFLGYRHNQLGQGHQLLHFWHKLWYMSQSHRCTANTTKQLLCKIYKWCWLTPATNWCPL